MERREWCTLPTALSSTNRHSFDGRQMSDSKLKIDADALTVTLEGTPENIADAYEALRPNIIDRFEGALDDDTPSDVDCDNGASTRTVDNAKTDPLFNVDAVEQQLAAGKELADVQLQLVVCTDLYYRVAALSRQNFRNSIFGSIFDSKALDSIFFSEGAAQRMKNQLQFGTTLWRELTDAGKAAVHGDSS